MRCPFCNAENSKVIESRLMSQGRAVRRRRGCIECNKRFTTYERVEETPIFVIKKDGRREEFNRQNVLKGLIRATEKREISRELIDNMVLDIEKEIQNTLKSEVSTKKIGKMLMERLKELDDVAYVRFASVYKEFTDLKSFVKEIEDINK